MSGLGDTSRLSCLAAGVLSLWSDDGGTRAVACSFLELHSFTLKVELAEVRLPKRNPEYKDLHIILKGKRQVKTFCLNAEEEKKFGIFLKNFNSNSKESPA